MEPEQSTASQPSDAELITAVRAGDQAAYGTLWSRHETAARGLARQLAKPSDVDELVSESFYRVLRALSGGGGPDGAFRPYLLSTLRRVNIDVGRSYHQRVSLTDDDAELEGTPGASAADITIEQGEQSAAWKAWASLPDSSRTLLWHLIVEEETPAQIAPLMGTTPNGVSSRAVRARERLRQAFLQQHVREADAEQCEWTRRRIGEHVRGALSNRERDAVARHLETCGRCKAVVAEIADMNSTLKGLIVPVILGGAAAGYLNAGGASHFLLFGQLRRLVRPSVVAGAGAVVAAAGIAAALVAANSGGHHKPAAIPPPPPASNAPASSAPAAPPGSPAPPPPSHRPPSTHPSTPAPRPTPTPTPSHTPTPTPPPASARPAPPPPARTPSPPPSSPAPPPTTPAPAPAHPTTSVEVPTGTFGSGDIGHGPHHEQGTLTLTVPEGWRIDSVVPEDPHDSCQITGTTTATCTLRSYRGDGSHTIQVTATGVEHPGDMLHAHYVSSDADWHQDYSL